MVTDAGPFPLPRQILQRPPLDTVWRTRIPRASANSRNSNVVKARPLYMLTCCHCDTTLSQAAEEGWCMASRDTRCHLFSATLVNNTVQVTGSSKYRTTLCDCERLDVGCQVCGNDIGYVVLQICGECTQARHNGHRYIIYPSSVFAQSALNNSDDRVSDRIVKHTPGR